MLVVFNTHIRESLLITDPSEKQFFTRTELELVSGIASKLGDQDSLEELMTPSDEELKFWGNQSVSQNYMIKDRFSDSMVSLDSKNKQLV